MMQYEKDFIYNTVPNLTKAINNLAAELKRFNDNQEKSQAPVDTVSIENDDDWGDK